MEANSSSSNAKPSLRPGTIIYDVDSSTGETVQFTCGRLLGEGGFAKCVEVSDGVHSYALKVVNRASLQKQKNLEKLRSEIAIHQRMKHKHIVNFIRSFKDKNYVYMLLEKCDCGTVKDLIKARPLNVEEAQYVMLQCLSATQYMHKNNIIHRDLKPGNIMLDSSLNVKIGDFGLATEMQFDGERKRTICGTPNYMAPEIIERNSDGHSFEVDTWSLGVILYTMLVGDPPFQMEDVQSTYRRIRQGLYEFPGHISEAAQDLIRCMLSTSPSNRPTLIDIRSHTFFSSPPPPMMTPVSLLAIARRYRHRSTSRRVAPSPSPAGGPQQQPQPVVHLGKQEGNHVPSIPLAVRDENQAVAHHRDALPKAESQSPRSKSPGVLRSARGHPQQALAAGGPQRGPPAPQGTRTSSGSYAMQAKYASPEEPQSHSPLTRVSGAGNAHLYSNAVSSPSPPQQAQGTATLSGRRRHTTEPGNGYRSSSPHLHPNNVTPVRTSSTTANPSQGPSDGEGRSSPVVAMPPPRRSLSAVQPSGGEAGAETQGRALSVPRVPSSVPLVQPTLWVRRCVDFTRKYGFCYLLSNDVVGAMFNDVTKLFWDLPSDQVVYIIRVHQTDTRGRAQEDEGGAPKRYSTDSPTWFPMNDYPESLKKKITLIKYFKSFLTEATYEKREAIVQCSNFNGSISGASRDSKKSSADPRVRRDCPPPGDENWIYVKGWAKVEDTHIFRFSNKSVQVCFADGSEMFFFWQMELVTYRQPGTDTEPPVQRTVPISEVRENSKLSVGLRYIRSAYRFHDMF